MHTSRTDEDELYHRFTIQTPAAQKRAIRVRRAKRLGIGAGLLLALLTPQPHLPHTRQRSAAGAFRSFAAHVVR